jgi:hypothetical protein
VALIQVPHLGGGWPNHLARPVHGALRWRAANHVAKARDGLTTRLVGCKPPCSPPTDVMLEVFSRAGWRAALAASAKVAHAFVIFYIVCVCLFVIFYFLFFSIGLDSTWGSFEICVGQRKPTRLDGQAPHWCSPASCTPIFHHR